MGCEMGKRVTKLGSERPEEGHGFEPHPGRQERVRGKIHGRESDDFSTNVEERRT